MIKPMILVLCVDVDNDLYEKAKINGPIIGKEENIKAAIKLIRADPEESDANAIFKAVKISEELEKNYDSKIITLTGSRKRGFDSDKKISEQLDRVLGQFPAESCVFVSDGVSDEIVMPIIKSRIKIMSVQLVTIKQAKQLEQTYFVILEKLKEPYYARLIFGIPAFFLILFSISSYYNLGWQPVGMITGIYLILKGFGIEESIFKFFSDFKFNVEKISWIAYVVAIPLILINIWINVDTYFLMIQTNASIIKIAATMLDKSLILIPFSILLIISGKMIDKLIENKKFEITKYGTYAINTLLFYLIFSAASNWIINETPPYVSFSDFINIVIYSVFLAYIGSKIMVSLKIEILTKMKLIGKEVITSFGEYRGKILGIDAKNEIMIIQTPFGKKQNISLKNIESIAEKIIVG